MKSIYFLLLFAMVSSGCLLHTHSTDIDKATIDSLKNMIKSGYRPGFGEFMSGIQSHHAKLWFAGLNSNWKLADFEVHEIIESLDGIEQYQKDRKETRLIPMIRPPLDSIAQAIDHSDTTQFRKDFLILTETCNKCHQTVDFGFNVVTIPKSLPVTNQDFKPR